MDGRRRQGGGDGQDEQQDDGSASQGDSRHGDLLSGASPATWSGHRTKGAEKQTAVPAECARGGGEDERSHGSGGPEGAPAAPAGLPRLDQGRAGGGGRPRPQLGAALRE